MHKDTYFSSKCLLPRKRSESKNPILRMEDGAVWSENSGSFRKDGVDPSRGSEGNLILVDLVGRGGSRRTRGDSTGGGGGEACATFGLEELEGFADNAQLGAFLTRGFVLPAVELEAAVDEEGSAFGDLELLEEFGHLAPEADVDIRDFFALLAGGGGVAAVDGEAEVGEGGGAHSLEFGFAGEVAHEGDFVVACHDF